MNGITHISEKVMKVEVFCMKLSTTNIYSKWEEKNCKCIWVSRLKAERRAVQTN